MVTMLIMSIIRAVSFVGIAVWRMGQLPKSISSIVWLFDGNWKWCWTIWLWLVTVLLAPALVSAMENSVLQFVGFFTIACLMLVGAWPLFNAEKAKWHHRVAVVAGCLSQICVAIISPWWLLAWFPMVVLSISAMDAFNDSNGIPRILDGKGVFLAEVICMVSLYGALLTAI